MEAALQFSCVQTSFLEDRADTCFFISSATFYLVGNMALLMLRVADIQALLDLHLIFFRSFELIDCKYPVKSKTPFLIGRD